MSTNECQNVFQDIQEGKKLRYAILKIIDGEIKLDKVGERESSHQEFFSNLQEKDDDGNDDCRYAIYNVCSSHVLLIFWCPESTKSDTKELYSSSVDAFKSFIGVRKYLYRIENIEMFEDIVADIKEIREKTLADAAKIAQANARGETSSLATTVSNPGCLECAARESEKHESLISCCKQTWYLFQKSIIYSLFLKKVKSVSKRLLLPDQKK